MAERHGTVQHAATIVARAAAREQRRVLVQQRLERDEEGMRVAVEGAIGVHRVTVAASDLDEDARRVVGHHERAGPVSEGEVDRSHQSVLRQTHRAVLLIRLLQPTRRLVVGREEPKLVLCTARSTGSASGSSGAAAAGGTSAAGKKPNAEPKQQGRQHLGVLHRR